MKRRSAAQFAAMEAALQETPRGRWFLSEFARRNRVADTDILLQAMARIEMVLLRSLSDRSADAASEDESGREEPADLAAEAEEPDQSLPVQPELPLSVREIAERLAGAVDALAQMREVTDEAQSEILAAAESIQDVSWQMRERGLRADFCDELERRTADIYAFCSRHDFAAQRTEKVIQLLRLTLQRLTAAALETEAARLHEPSSADAADSPETARPADSANGGEAVEMQPETGAADDADELDMSEGSPYAEGTVFAEGSPFADNSTVADGSSFAAGLMSAEGSIFAEGSISAEGSDTDSDDVAARLSALEARIAEEMRVLAYRSIDMDGDGDDHVSAGRGPDERAAQGWQGDGRPEADAWPGRDFVPGRREADDWAGASGRERQSGWQRPVQDGEALDWRGDALAAFQADSEGFGASYSAEYALGEQPASDPTGPGTDRQAAMTLARLHAVKRAVLFG